MPKRKSLYDPALSCPNCEEMFDPEIHIPFLGTCFHSLCGVCVNEKHIETCRMCDKKGAFASKQRNDLALVLLKAMSENEAMGLKKPKFDAEEETYFNQPVPAVLASKNRPFLANIVNQLDPASFLKLTRTCKYLHNYCFHSKDIKIEYEISRMCVSSKTGVFGFTLRSASENSSYRYRPSNYVGYGCGFLGSMLNRKKLRDYPIVFKIRDLMFEADMDSDFMAKTRSFFAEFPIQRISNITVSENIIHWNGLIQLLKDFHINDVCIERGNRNNRVPDDVAAYILQNTIRFECYGDFPEHLLLNASVKGLDLSDANFSQKTFVDLLRKFAETSEEIQWTLGGSQSFEFGHYDLFKILPFDYKRPLPKERPLVFAKSGNNDRFCILRKDCKVLECTKSGSDIEFSTKSFGFPPVFPNRYYESEDSSDFYDEASVDFYDESSDDD